MSTHHEVVIDEMTGELYREHLALLNGMIEQLRAVTGRLHKRIADLQQRLECAVDANQTLRVENAGLAAALREDPL